jgi:glycosyltransferase involved in cell wall biosynthesis
MNTPLVSVIVPVYNVENYIEKCVRSLFEQTYNAIEYIFVNDCSSDGSIKVLENTLKKYPDRKAAVTTIHHTTNRGLPTARNSGLASAKGKYILHCDSDDWTDKDWVKALVDHAEDTQADIVFCDIYNVYANKKIIYRQKKGETYVDHLKALFRGDAQGSVCNKLVRRDLYSLNAIRFPDGFPMLEDLRTVVQLYFYATKIEYEPKPLYYYIKSRTTSITGSGSRSEEVSVDGMENVLAIEAFLKSKGIKGICLELSLLKLTTKKNLLINANDVGVLRKWKDTFPEANQYIHASNLPLHYKMITYCILKNRWVLPVCWIYIKKIKHTFFN